jgi:hypothetical protein
VGLGKTHLVNAIGHLELVYGVRSCGTCEFFWPERAPQPYGPYPTYDFASNTPTEKEPAGTLNSLAWLQGTTRPPAFPDAEVMDGCRKAPIMTIGINPNLAAFAPGKTGAYTRVVRDNLR